MRVFRYLLVILGTIGVIAGLGAIKGAQIKSLMDFGEKATKAGPPPATVSALSAKKDAWERVLSAVGSVASSKGVAVTAEVSGKVTRIRFESGDMIDRGQILVELDTSVERAQLASLVSRRKLAKTTLGRSRSLREGGAIPQAQLDADESSLDTLQADIGALQAQIAKKIIRAPFSGRLGIRSVNLGQYLNPGQAVTVLESVDGVYVDFSLPQENLGVVSVGMPVRIGLKGVAGKPWPGAIVAVDPTVDPVTRTMGLRASVEVKGEGLRPGMFVDVAVVFPEKRDYVVVPSTAIVYQPYGNSVFVVEDKPANDPGMRETEDGKAVKIARQQFVQTGERRGDYVAVLKGLEGTESVVVSGGFKLRNKSPIIVSEAVAIAPELAPKPANR
ncbi:MAG: efflux RND transporter periplasmic adaptor subunit [Myxococcota bacterium]